MNGDLENEFEAGPVNVTGTPDRIWLNLGDFSYAGLAPYADVPFKDLDEVSWSDMAHDRDDVEYVRADTVTPGLSMAMAVRLCAAAVQACPPECQNAVSDAVTAALTEALNGA
jgi:hypothetical protein